MACDKTKIIVVVGPTASGKTALAVDLAKRYNGEVISADSMQIYKNMSIGTAKPTLTEMDGIPHHLIDFVDPADSFSVADYVTVAHKVIEDVISRGKLPIIAGGTGLYVNSLVEDIRFDDTKSDEGIRRELEEFSKENGVDALFEILQKIDPIASETIDKNNIPRVIRAIEVYRLTGTTLTEQKIKSREVPSRYNALKIGISFENRALLYKRINKRVDIMLSNGLLNEAEEIFNSSYYKTALQAIGYKELFAYFKGEVSCETAIDKLKQGSRRYAKRQLTWFRRDDEINWFMYDQYENIHFMQKNIYNLVDNFLKVCYD